MGTGRRKRRRQWLNGVFFAFASNVGTEAAASGGDKFGAGLGERATGVDGEGDSIGGGAKTSPPVLGCKVRALWCVWCLVVILVVRDPYSTVWYMIENVKIEAGPLLLFLLLVAVARLTPLPLCFGRRIFRCCAS